MRLRAFGAVLAVVALLAPAAGEELQHDKVLDAFAKIAFGNEFTPEPDPRLHKWVKPIRWRAYDGVGITPDEREFLDRHMARLARLTGLDFSEAAGWPETNFIIYFVSEWRYESAIERYLDPNRRHLLPRFADTTCVGLMRHHRRSHEIEFAIAIIPVERARARRLVQSCIAEETTQVLGLRNDSNEVFDTLFNDIGTARDLTALDEVLVRLLYDPKLKPGLSRDEALAIAREVLPKLRGPR